MCTGMGSPDVVQAAPAAAQVDETMYVNLDYYGKIDQVSVVKGCSLNGNTSLTDYGNYRNVVNMSGNQQPQMENGSLTWSFEESPSDRFYYQCSLDPAQVTLPWDFDVSYKLNGVPANGEDLAGASGVVEIHILAEPNDEAEEYYRNNMVLMAAVPVDRSKCYSVEAEGSQTQSLGGNDGGQPQGCVGIRQFVGTSGHTGGHYSGAHIGPGVHGDPVGTVGHTHLAGIELGDGREFAPLAVHFRTVGYRSAALLQKLDVCCGSAGAVGCDQVLPHQAGLVQVLHRGHAVGLPQEIHLLVLLGHVDVEAYMVAAAQFDDLFGQLHRDGVGGVGAKAAEDPSVLAVIFFDQTAVLLYPGGALLGNSGVVVVLDGAQIGFDDLLCQYAPHAQLMDHPGSGTHIVVDIVDAGDACLESLHGPQHAQGVGGLRGQQSLHRKRQTICCF